VGKKFRVLICIFLIFLIVYGYFYFKYKDKSFILVYHKINYYKSGLKSLYVRPELFDKQMRYLKNRGYKTVSLNRIVELINNKQKFPKKIFTITFDDGYEDNYIYAYPILKKYGYTATIFLATKYIGKEHIYPGQSPEKHLSINEIKQMLDIIEFYSHSYSHPDFTKLSRKKIKDELIKSKKEIEKITAKNVDIFCYPFGKYNNTTIEILKQTGYKAGCSLEHKLIDFNSNLFILPRYEFKDINAMSINDFIKNFDFYLKTFLGI